MWMENPDVPKYIPEFLFASARKKKTYTHRQNTYPADCKEKVQFSRAGGHAMAQLPVDQVLPGKHQQTQAHGHQQHVEDPSHVVNIQFTAHHLNFVIMTDTRQPEALQHLNFIWKRDEGGQG